MQTNTTDTARGYPVAQRSDSARPTPLGSAASGTTAAAGSDVTSTIPAVGRVPVAGPPSGSRGTYVADSFAGDISMTSGGTPALAHDGEPAGLARVTLAMRKPGRDESPAPRRLIGLCAWAAAIGILGILIALRALVSLFIGAPAWFLPVAGAIGLAGVACTMGAFVTARQRTVPWLLLGGATCALVAAVVTIEMV